MNINSKEDLKIALNAKGWDVRLVAKLSNSHMIIKNLDDILDYMGDFRC